jgi:hypothetical protein
LTGAFIRTFKLNLDNSKKRKKVDRAYLVLFSSMFWAEITLSIYA